VGLVTNCGKCVDLVANNLDERAYTEGLREIASFADVNAVRFMLDHGAKVTAPTRRAALR